MERLCPKCNFFIGNESTEHELGWGRTKNICANCGTEVLDKLAKDGTADPNGECPSNG